MFRLIIFVLAAFSTTCASAQWWGYNYYPQRFMPTYVNYYVYSQPRYTSPPLSAQQLYDRRMKNSQAKDKYEQYLVDSAIARREAALENAERFAAIKAKEEVYRQRGYLPPLPTRKFVHNGIDYGTWANFQQSPEFEEYVAEIEEWRAAEDRRDAQKKHYQETVHLRFLQSRSATVSQTPKQSVVQSLQLDLALGLKSQEDVDKALALLESLK